MSVSENKAVVISMLPPEAVDRYRGGEINEADFIAVMLYWAIEPSVILAIIDDCEEDFELVTLH